MEEKLEVRRLWTVLGTLPEDESTDLASAIEGGKADLGEWTGHPDLFPMATFDGAPVIPDAGIAVCQGDVAVIGEKDRLVLFKVKSTQPEMPSFGPLSDEPEDAEDTVETLVGLAMSVLGADAAAGYAETAKGRDEIGLAALADEIIVDLRDRLAPFHVLVRDRMDPHDDPRAEIRKDVLFHLCVEPDIDILGDWDVPAADDGGKMPLVDLRDGISVVKHINDHGNATLLDLFGAEIWAVV